MKHLLKHLLLCLCLFAGINALAYDAEIGGIYYNFSGDKATVTYRYYHSSSNRDVYYGEIIIPESVTYNGKPYSVTSIGDDAFYKCWDLTSIYIPGSVTSIGNSAFYNCSGLTSITIPNSVTSIGDHAFSFCSSLTSITIPGSVTSIGDYAFYYCSSLTSITIPGSVTSIGYEAFYECSSLTSITIPSSVTSIGNRAFYNCSRLTSVTIPGSVTSIGSSAFYGCSYLTSITIPGSVTSIGEYAFRDCSGLTSITIPGSVTSIGNSAFEGTAWYKKQPDGLVYAGKVAYKYKGTMPSDTRITIEEGTLGIADGAFRDCSGLTSVTIQDGVTSIGGEAFEGCSGLTSITIPGSVTSIGNSAFYKCSVLASITIPSSVTSIGYYAFYECSSLTSVTIPGSVTSIGEAAFSGTAWYNNQPDGLVYAGKVAYKYKGTMPSDTRITIEEGTLGIAGGAFSDCSGLTSITIPGSVTSIGSSAFSYCKGLTSVTIPNSVTSIGNSAFQNCSGLTSVTIPSSVTSIGSYAFQDCSGLTSVTIPGSVTSIGYAAFSGCSSLTDVYCYVENVPTTSTYAFYSSPIASATLHVPAASLEQYKATAPWSGFGTIVAIEEDSPIIEFADDNVKTLCVANWDTNGDGELSEAEAAAVTDIEKTFSGNKLIGSFDELKYFTGLTSIEDNAFRDCYRLTSITIPSSVTSIGERAFTLCSSLTSVIIPGSVTSIGGGAFRDCSGLTSVTIQDGVPSIGSGAFGGCSGLTSVTIPSSVTSIGDGAFYGCSGLTSIKVEAGNTTYDSRGNCNAIIETATNTLIAGCKNTTIPNSVTSIGEYAFYECSGLTSITIPGSVTSIGNFAFYNCTGLTDVYCYAENVPTTSTYAFYSSPIASATLHVPAGSLEAYKTTWLWSSFGSIVPIEGYTTYTINDEMASLSIETEESGCIVEFTHNFNGDWEALCLPFAIDYDAIRADFDLAEIDGVVQNDDNNDGTIDFTVLSIRGFKEQTTEPNTPYLIRAKNAGEQTISFEDITVYPTAITSVDCSSTSTKYEFTGSYNALNASALADRYIINNGELVKGGSHLAPCRWYMTATARKGSLNLPAKIRIMPVEDVITGVSPLGETEEGTVIYNLAGQRLSKPQKGFNIQNGKKVLIK